MARKPNKLVRIEIELEMSDGAFKTFKPQLKDLVTSYIVDMSGGKLVYLAVDAS